MGGTMEDWNETAFDLLEQNAKWWEQAALACEHIAAHNGTGKKEEWQLMGAIYRERAQKHVQFIEQLRQDKSRPIA
jgi:hypothetical protein